MDNLADFVGRWTNNILTQYHRVHRPAGAEDPQQRDMLQIQYIDTVLALATPKPANSALILFPGAFVYQIPVLIYCKIFLLAHKPGSKAEWVLEYVNQLAPVLESWRLKYNMEVYNKFTSCANTFPALAYPGKRFPSQPMGMPIYSAIRTMITRAAHQRHNVDSQEMGA